MTARHASPLRRAQAFFSRHPYAALAVLYALLAGAALNPTLHGADGHGNYAPLRSMLFDGDLDFANDYALFDAATGGQFRFRDIPIEKATGRPGNRYGIGASVLWAPFVAPVRGWGLLRGREETGLESRYIWVLGIGSAFWAGVGLAMLLALCRHFWRPAASWMAVGAALALSPLPFYIFFHTSMSHAAAFFATTGFLGAWIMALRAGRRVWFAGSGIFAGLAVMTRPQDAAVVVAAFALGVFLTIVLWLRAQRLPAHRLLLSLGITSGIALAAFLPQLLAWNALYGSPFAGPAPYLRYSGFHLLKPVHALPSLFSSNHGLFFWHPLLAVGLAGLAISLRRWRIAPLALLLAFAATWYIASAWQVWHAGASFGNRFYLSVLAVFAAGWAALGDRFHRRRQAILLWALIALGGAWNAGLAVQYGTGMIPRQGEVAFSTLLDNQFTRVPGVMAAKAWQALGRSPALADDENARRP